MTENTNQTGRIRYTLRNDYMFKAVLQKNQRILKELLAVLLEIPMSSIRSLKIENPIVLGESVDSKTVVLDILMTLNDDEIINIEMQVKHQPFWENRTLVYVTRPFHQLNKGEDYDKVKRVVHIGILDFSLEEEGHHFYSKYRLMNTKTHRIYSDKLQVNVLSLKELEYATEEDRASGLYDWAKLFAANTWEELRDLAEKSEVFQEVVVTLRELSEDERIQMQCEARELNERTESTWKNMIKRAEAKAEEAEAKAAKDIAEAKAVFEHKLAEAEENARKEREASKLQLEELMKQLEEARSRLKEQEVE